MFQEVYQWTKFCTSLYVESKWGVKVIFECELCSLWVFHETIPLFDFQNLLVPIDKEIRVYDTSTWEQKFSLSDMTIKEASMAI